MFSHIMLGTNDVDRAKAFYDAVLAVVGAPAGVRNVARSGHVRVFYPRWPVQIPPPVATMHLILTTYNEILQLNIQATSLSVLTI